MGIVEPAWQLNNGNIFTYDSASNKLLCHTTELKKTTHPFAEIFNRNSGKFRKLKEFLIHPTLPFGIVAEIGKDIDWSNKKSWLPVMDRHERGAMARERQTDHQQMHAGSASLSQIAFCNFLYCQTLRRKTKKCITI